MMYVYTRIMSNILYADNQSLLVFGNSHKIKYHHKQWTLLLSNEHV
jgi:hypothetical protein